MGLNEALGMIAQGDRQPTTDEIYDFMGFAITTANRVFKDKQLRLYHEIHG